MRREDFIWICVMKSIFPCFLAVNLFFCSYQIFLLACVEYFPLDSSHESTIQTLNSKRKLIIISELIFTTSEVVVEIVKQKYKKVLASHFILAPKWNIFPTISLHSNIVVKISFPLFFISIPSAQSHIHLNKPFSHFQLQFDWMKICFNVIARRKRSKQSTSTYKRRWKNI